MAEQTFQPTMTQAFRGAKWETCEAPDFVSHGLYALSKAMRERGIGDPGSGGLFGGEHGYGHDFANEVFSMFPYWWDDCTCGHDKQADDWYAANPHASGCYSACLKRLRHESGRDVIDCDESTRRAYEAARDALCDRFGLSRTDGCEVHCTCSHEADYAVWCEANDHAPDCKATRPNFYHKPSGLAVHWYKYIGRGMSANREINAATWEAVMAECLASLGAGT